MLRRQTWPVALLACLFVIHFAETRAEAGEPTAIQLNWQKLNPLPNVHGVAAPFAGVHNSALIVAGGANFPEKMPWEGGKKVWHDRVWLLDQPAGAWRDVGTLPQPLAYGVSISTPDGVICIGGSNDERHFADVFEVSWRNGKLETKTLPPLPHPVANACGAMLGTTILVAGGTETPTSITALKTFFTFDFADPKPVWKTLEPWPGPARMLAVAAVQDGSFWLISGADISADNSGKPKRRYLTDAYRFRPNAGWTRVADVPRAVVAAPSPAIETGTKQFLIVGGDDGTKVDFQPPDQHPGFSRTVLMYDTIANTWTSVGQAPVSRVTAPTVKWADQWLIISGEQKPGVRSPDVWSLRFKD